ncbi:MAG: hypothetical protein LUH09_08925 [Clostridiales bacterium]|nr:hypothetical protein [Clostridiales bacterium]
MTRGFVTIATGDEQYYKLARNLLHSYQNQVRPEEQVPFAILCDRDCADTKEFDDVVIMENPNRSYMDKLMLYKYSPYDETIFIDADSLFFRDPQGLWEDFGDQDDVSCYGVALPLDSQKAWFSYEGCGQYQDQIQYLIDLHGGAYYFRRTERTKQIFELAISLASEYHQYGFRNFDHPADEPVMAMAMAIRQCRPCEKAAGGGVSCSSPATAVKRASTRREGCLCLGRSEMKCSVILQRRTPDCFCTGTPHT